MKQKIRRVIIDSTPPKNSFVIFILFLSVCLPKSSYQLLSLYLSMKFSGTNACRLCPYSLHQYTHTHITHIFSRSLRTSSIYYLHYLRYFFFFLFFNLALLIILDLKPISRINFVSFGQLSFLSLPYLSSLLPSRLYFGLDLKKNLRFFPNYYFPPRPPLLVL